MTHITGKDEKVIARLVKKYGATNVVAEAHEQGGKRVAHNPRRRKYYEFTPEDVGQWIDGALGHQHAMQKMADMLGDVDSQRAQNLLQEYDDDELDDESESEWLDDATEALQEVTREGLVWEWEAGDLALREEE